MTRPSRIIQVLVALVACLYVPGLVHAEMPLAYRLEERLFYERPADPNPVAKVYVSGDRVRREVYVDGKLTKTLIARPDRSLVYLINDSQRSYEQATFDARRDAPPHRRLAVYQEQAREGILALASLGRETINGLPCEKYAITYGTGPPQFHLWISTSTQLPVLKTTGALRVEWTNLRVAPQPAELFQPPPDYRKLPSSH